MKTLKQPAVVVALMATLLVGVATGFWMPRDDDLFELRKNFEIFSAAYEEIVTEYVRPVDAGHLMQVGLEAMIDELDPYTSFIEDADDSDIDIITRGSYGGVGLNVELRGDQVTVLSAVEGSSAYEEGVRAGDIITAVNDHPTEDMALADIRNLLRGEPGTEVDITIERAGTRMDLTLTREEVQLDNVTYAGFLEEPAESLAYIQLERFTRDAGRDVREAIQDLSDERTMDGLVLDLRDNPGGLLNAAVDVAELFVPEGEEIVSTRGRADDSDRSFTSSRSPLLSDTPLVVLVNEHSASASEIVAGAMQDLDRGVVLGTRTFGKGLVQVVKSLPYNSSLKMTTAQYFTPSGRSIQSVDYSADTTATLSNDETQFTTRNGRSLNGRDGIAPDITVEPSSPSALEQALQREAAFFYYANDFAAERDDLTADFTATEDMLADFREWLDGEDFTYTTEAEQSVTQLRNELAELGHDDLDGPIDSLRAAVQPDLDADFERHADDLKRQLQEEVLARVASQHEQIEAQLQYDEQVQEAVTLLQDDESYQDILTVSN